MKSKQPTIFKLNTTMITSLHNIIVGLIVVIYFVFKDKKMLNGWYQWKG